MYWYKIVVNYMMLPIIVGMGVAGNTMGLVVFLRKKMKTVGPVHMYQILFVVDTFFLLQSIDLFAVNIFNTGFRMISKETCKIALYLVFASYIVSPMALCYISIEKLVSIKYPGKRFLLRKKKVQVLLFLSVIFARFNLSINSHSYSVFFI